MKFMIINRPNGRDAGMVGGSPARLRGHAKTIRGLLKAGQIECCYLMIGGGHVYVVNVDDTDELMQAVRRNPLFEESHTDVIPIADAHDFLERYADQLETDATIPGSTVPAA